MKIEHFPGAEKRAGNEPSVIPAFVYEPDFTGGNGRSIGTILVERGRLKASDIERIVALQRESGMRFGDAAKQLELVSEADIETALAHQFDYPYLQPGDAQISTEVVAAYEPSSAQVEALRALRVQLMLRWFDGDPAHKALAVVSGAREEGRSYLCANLAVVFSQLGQRTLLVDADLRRPSQHRLFGLSDRIGLSAVLSGRTGLEHAVQRIAPLLNLSVLPAGTVPPNPQDLLARPAFASLLEHLGTKYDVILLDSPPAGEAADAQAIVVRCGAALVLARKNSSRSWRVQGISDTVAQSKAAIVGAVLNDF